MTECKESPAGKSIACMFTESDGRVYRRTGYIYCTSDEICDSALFVARDDDVMIFPFDRQAAEQAEVDGFCKIIHDLPEFFEYAEDGAEPFVDTPKNREHIMKYLKKVYDYDWVY